MRIIGLQAENRKITLITLRECHGRLELLRADRSLVGPESYRERRACPLSTRILNQQYLRETSFPHSILKSLIFMRRVGSTAVLSRER
jgi:hypothetical protein